MIRSWTFQKKVRAGFAVMVSVAILTAVIAVYALRTVTASKDSVIAVNAQCLIDAARLQAAAEQQAAGFRGYIASVDPRFLKEWSEAQDTIGRLFREMPSIVRTDQGQALLGEIQKLETALSKAQNEVIAARTSKGGLEASLRLLREEVLPIRLQLISKIDSFAEREQRLLDLARAQATARATVATVWLICLAAAVALFATATAFLLGRTLSRQIGSVVQHVQSSSAELQTTANQQAAGAKETATAMSEVSTTMSELLATSRQITDSAQQVAHIADQTATAARSGDLTVTKAQESIEGIRRQVNTIVGHMLELGKKSQLIGGVLDIITELAEQTNILSINATIEAAGAGEQGKRFAVVGDEIRKLADRVGGSTKEIRALVEEIRGAVNTTVLATESGSKAVDAGLREFEELTRGFKNIAELVVTTTQAAREIELSTKQQMSAVEQVNTAISGAAQASRENEASSTQTLQTATQLAHLSHNLSLIVQSHASA